MYVSRRTAASRSSSSNCWTSKADLLTVWCKRTGDPVPEARHRIRALSEADLLPSRAHPHHVSGAFVLGKGDPAEIAQAYRRIIDGTLDDES